MPRKKDYGPATRKSQRLTTASEDSENDIQEDEIAEGTEPEEPARLPASEIKSEPILPSIEDSTESEEIYDSAAEETNIFEEDAEAAQNDNEKERHFPQSD